MAYIPHTSQDIKQMLEVSGKQSISQFFEDIPKDIVFNKQLDIPEAMSELELKRYFNTIASKNSCCLTSFLGAGSYSHFIPSAVKSITSKGAFFTAYTPYQAEASQGTLQAIYEFQSYMAMLTGTDVSNASLYDGATALCEAAIIACAEKKKCKVVISDGVHPEYRETLLTYNGDNNIVTLPTVSGVTDPDSIKNAVDEKTSAIIIQSPNFFGCIEDITKIAEIAKASGTLLIVVINELYSAGVLKTAGECGADIVVGDAQSFGNPTAFGGPSLGFMGVKSGLMRKIPGRLCGKTKDSEGNDGYVLTLQAREQHIRRDKSSSNICSNQALCALAASANLSLIGKKGLKDIAVQNVQKSHYAAQKLTAIKGLSLKYPAPFFNEFTLKCDAIAPEKLISGLREKGFIIGLPLGRFYPAHCDSILVCVTETATKEMIDGLAMETEKIMKGATA